MSSDSFSELSDEVLDDGTEGQHREVGETDDEDGDAGHEQCEERRAGGQGAPDAGIRRLRPREPAMARTGTIRANRPTSMAIACVMLYQLVLPARPANAEPLLLAGEVKA